jgi:hypothetical protein
MNATHSTEDIRNCSFTLLWHHQSSALSSRLAINQVTRLKPTELTAKTQFSQPVIGIQALLLKLVERLAVMAIR